MEDNIAIWTRWLKEQKESGLSISAWCKNNHIKTGRFFYWKNRVFPKKEKITFTEIKIKASPITIESGNLSIRIDPGCDLMVLKDILSVLKEI